MHLRKQLLYYAAGTLLLFSSCQKDLDLKNDSVNGDMVSSEATANNTIETSPPVHTSVRYNVNSNVAGFWQTVPARYHQTTKRYPLIVFIHGIGELGTSLSRMNCCGLPRHLKNKSFPANFKVNGQNYSFIVISPQFKKRPKPSEVQSVIDFARRRWRIDDSRIYVTGLSMGGGSTWDWSAIYGQKAAAIVPVCAGTRPTTTMASRIASKNLPIWGLYSSADKVVPVSWGRNFFNWIDARNKNYASRTKLTVWTDASHNSTWGRAFNPATKVGGFNIYQWMLLYKRGGSSSAPSAPAPAPAPAPSTGSNKAPVAIGGSDKTIYLRTGINRVLLDGTASRDNDGKITKYVWTKISGPSTTLWVKRTGQTYAAHLKAGTYTFRLTVTDNRGARHTDDVRVVVKAWSIHPPSGSSSSSNKKPIARAGSDQTIYLRTGINRALLNGTSSYDSDGRIVKYHWTKLSGPHTDMWTLKAGHTYAAHLVKGTYVFRLTITDNKGATATDNKVVYVK